VARFGGPGFHVGVTRDDGLLVEATWEAAGPRKRVAVGDDAHPRITDALGAWLAVAFLPTDLALVQGAASERRRWLDRMLSLGSTSYLEGLLRYRAAVAQRNAALRRGDARVARLFDAPMARAGAVVMAGRLAWLVGAEGRWQEELAAVGEPLAVTLRYRGEAELADPEAWVGRLEASGSRDLARGQTHVGPHRDDVVLGLAGRSLREFGSTGQQRSAAIALRLLEHRTLTERRNTAPPLLVDDIFAELDASRQAALASRLIKGGAQLVVTGPRAEDVPHALEVPRWHVNDGVIRSA
jgi:DNA replication and repair protein RecF